MRPTRPRSTLPAALAAVATVAALAAGVAPASAHASPSPRPTPTSVPGTALPSLGTAQQRGATGDVGARVPFTEYEAEDATTDGTVVGPSRAYTQLASEASGREAVRLRAGQHLDVVLAAPANAVDVRYSVPDGTDTTLALTATDPAGRATALPPLALTSRYSWAYGNYPFTNDPADGGAHHFFDDARTLLGTTLPAGTTVRFTAHADGTVLDLADLEVATRTAAPRGSVDATAFGADPTGTTDSGEALQAAIDAASSAGKTLYVPAGTYRVNRQLVVDDVTVVGAGAWYTTLTGDKVGVFGKGAPGSTGVHLSGFAIEGTTVVRNDQTTDSGLGGVIGGGSTITDLWIEHTKVGAWLDGPSDGLTLSRLRIQNTWADGINLHDGVAHTTVSDTFVRNTGDDGMAMWSDRDADHDNAFTRDTVVLPILANAYAVYGGHDNAVTRSVAADTVTHGGGVHVGNRFGAVPLAGTTTVTDDVLLRTGSLNPDEPVQDGAFWLWAADAPITGRVVAHGLTILDSSYAAIQVHGSSVAGLDVSDVRIDRAGTFAVQLEAAGSGTFRDVVATHLGASTQGRPFGVLDDGSGFALTRQGRTTGWNGTTRTLPALGQLELAEATGVDFGFQELGTTTARTLTIHNPGPRAVTVEQVRPPAGFTLTRGCTTVAAGASCTLELAFSPTASANYSGLVTIDSTSPAGPYVVMLTGVGFDPDGNLALGRSITSSSQASGFGPANAVDGNPATYFESLDGAGYPQTVTLDLGETFSVDRIVLRLPPGWGARTQNIGIEADGAPLVPATDYTLDPAVDDNAVTITFPATDLRTLTFTLSGNTGWPPASQLSEIEVYAH
ncbi:choice-of-anchor D domain-containing protein [Luteimicrobium sp. NPDC057192]|uniref:choice-of-anchor D domain-containing protein n=1 Tax=Luteimicrobium sp. NPDC057192 TaxID=3346042 RepID=UPI003635F511